CRKFEGSAAYFDDLAKGGVAVAAVTFRIGDLALVKRNIPQMQIGFYHQKPRHFCALDDLNRVENTYIREISRERDIRAHLLRRAVAVRREFGTACAANGFEPRCNRNSRIEEL